MSGKMTMLEAINLALHDAMASDDQVLVLGEDVADPEEGGVVGITKGLSSKFGNHRVKSTPIAEQAIIGAAIGAAIAGFKPVAEIMLMNFTTVAMDMIVNHAAKLRFMSGGQTSVPMVIPDHDRCWHGQWRTAQRFSGSLVCPYRRIESMYSVKPGRRLWIDAGVHQRS